MKNKKHTHTIERKKSSDHFILSYTILDVYTQIVHITDRYNNITTFNIHLLPYIVCTTYK